MVIVPETQRMFPEQNVPFLDMTVDDLFANMLEIKRANCPNWTDETDSDLGIQLLWMFSVLSEWLTHHMNRIKDNSFLISAWDREHIRRLCQLINYQLSEASAASVNITFTLESGHPGVTIPQGTQVSTKKVQELTSIIFETNAETIVSPGVEEIDITCTQGETTSQKVLASSDGTTNQYYVLSQKPIIWQSETVELYEDGAWVQWTRVDNFIESGGSDKHYTVMVDEDNNYTIKFGDGTNGKIPNRGINNVRVSYRKGGGNIGNVAEGTIIELVSSITYVESVINSEVATGGGDRETLDHAKLFAPFSIRTLDRIVTVEDIESLAESYISPIYGGIAKAKAFRVGALALSVMIVPQSGGNPSTGFKSELQSYLEDRKILGTSLQVINPMYRGITITVDITIAAGYAMSQVVSEVRKQLIGYLSPVYQDPTTNLYPYGFGRNVYLSDLYRLIDSISGVDHCQITLPTGDVITSDYEIIMPGVITITTEGATEGVGYYSGSSGIIPKESTRQAQ